LAIPHQKPEVGGKVTVGLRPLDRPERILRMLNRRCGARASLLFAAAGLVCSIAFLSPATVASESLNIQQASIRSSTLGTSTEGRAIELITISSDPENADRRPALLIVAGIDATHHTGILVARDLATRLAAEHADLLATTTVYIVPLLNPDADARRTQRPIGAFDLRSVPKPIDLDRDRRFDEDGPNDLNDDGYITQMRVRNPAPGSGLVATHVPHEDDPRLMRPADAGKGETPLYAILIEGVDDDGDGRIAEDPVGGIDLSRHFPYLWDEFDPVTGDYPIEVSEAKAIADWMLEQSNIIAVLAYGPHDTLSKLPVDGRFDSSRRVPLGIETADKADYERVQKAFIDATGLKEAEGRSNEGTFHGWTYAHLGLFSFSTPLWSTPTLASAEAAADEPAAPAESAPDEETAERLSLAEIQSMIAVYESGSESEQAELMQRFSTLPKEEQDRIMAIASGEADPLSAAPPAPPAADPPRSARRGSAPKGEAAWLAYADERGEGFVDWQPFDHPQLGEVEIGGFVPGFKMNAPSDQITAISEQQSAFIGELLSMFGSVTVDATSSRHLGAGVYQIGLRLHNPGKLATRPAIADKTRRLPPIIVRPQLDRESIITGDPAARIERIGPGASEDFIWTVRTAGREIDIRISVPETGDQTITITLPEGN